VSEPAFVREADREWETWPDELVEERGRILWKTLVSGDVTPSDGLTLGVAKLPPGEGLREHHHEQAEVYLFLAGDGLVTVDGEARSVGPGAAVFIPGNAPHSCENTGASELRFAYVLAADSFADVEYVFGR
jgi:mannose-6-phosphate isomerase-like protein (cupin superfamily)